MTYQPKEGQDAITRDGRRVSGVKWSSLRSVTGWIGNSQYGWAEMNDGSWYAGFTRDLDLVGPWVEPNLQSDIEVHDSSGNVFADLGLPPRVHPLESFTLSCPASGPGKLIETSQLKAVAEEIRAFLTTTVCDKPTKEAWDVWSGVKIGYEQCLAIVEKHMEGK